MKTQQQNEILAQNEHQRTKCLVYTRVMGYHRPVESFNIGKRESTNSVNTLLDMSTLTPIYDITPFTLLDYPDKVACIIWFSGCNMRCLYCYNPDLVLGKGKISYAEVLSFLQSRKGMLEAVVLSGGECTMHGDLIELIKAIRVMGFLVKVDTNGSRPLVIEQLVREQLVDYLAVDFKAMPQNFAEQTGSDLFASFEHTLTFLVASQQSFEVRTTVHDDLIDNADFNKMVDYLVKMKYTGTYYVQHFVNNVRTLAQLGFSNKQLKKVIKLELI